MLFVHHLQDEFSKRDQHNWRVKVGELASLASKGDAETDSSRLAVTQSGHTLIHAEF